MQAEQHELLQTFELGVLAQTLSGIGLPVEVGCAQIDAAAGRQASMLRVGRDGGPVILETSRTLDFARLWDGTDDEANLIASVSTPALLVACATRSRTNVAWALDIASEIAILMLATPPPDRTVLHVAVPEVLTGSVPHVVSSESAARALFLAGKVTLSPFRWDHSMLRFGVEQEHWAKAAVDVLSPRLGGGAGFCGCCSSHGAAAYVSNYSERS